MVTALDRLGRDTLGLLELINRLATKGVDLKVLDMPVAAGGHRAGQYQRADEAGPRMDPSIGQAGRATLEHIAGEGAYYTTDEEGLGNVSFPDRGRSGRVGIAAAAGPED